MTKDQLDEWEGHREMASEQAIDLGLCNVQFNVIGDHCYLEILPAEMAKCYEDTDGVEGVLVQIMEEECHVDSIVKMIIQQSRIREARQNGEYVKRIDPISHPLMRFIKLD